MVKALAFTSRETYVQSEILGFISLCLASYHLVLLSATGYENAFIFILRCNIFKKNK